MSSEPLNGFKTARELRENRDATDATDAPDDETGENPCLAGTVRCNGPNSRLPACSECARVREARDALEEGGDP